MTQTLHRSTERPYSASYNPQFGASIPAADPWDQPAQGQRFAAPRQPMHAAPYAPYQPQPQQPPYAQQPYPQRFDFQAPPRNNKKLLLLGGGAAVAIVGLIVALIVVLATSNGDGGPDDKLIPAGDLTSEPSKPAAPSDTEDTPKSEPSTSDDEEAIQDMFDEFGAAVATGDPREWIPFHCKADREILDRANMSDLQKEPIPYSGSLPLDDIEVKGKRATAEFNNKPVKFVKESGDWKICMM